ncbi:TonB-dependent receptor family protein [Luteimonas cucumeris]|uniref:TonB-dependent receptor family protein n=1 Tax=Luteimonas cucumeris TaxID=985012 RepID=UPI0018F793ED|nr:TonB-dependent receptor [Luteimonas cucumeris]
MAAVLVSPWPALAADPQSVEPTTLDRVEVVAQTSRPTTIDSLEQAQERLGQRAGATAVVDGESYRERRSSTLSDALNQAPGVFAQTRFGAEEARLSIRGSGLQRTFHGRGLVLLQDGSPLNLADGGFDFQAVEPLAARYVEVYRGANALEYGAATLGGAINFVAPTGYDAAPVTLRAETGSYGYRRGQAALAGHSDRVDGYVSATGFRQDGFRDHAMQQNHRLFGNAGVRFDDRLEGRFYLTHVDTRSQLPGNLTRAESDADPTQAAPGNLALDQRRDYTLDRIAGKLAWTPSADRALTLSLYYADKSLDHPIFQVLRQDSRDYGADLRWRGESRLGDRRNVLIAGLAFARGRIDDDRFANVAGVPGARTNAFAQRAGNAQAYFENQTWLDDRWVLALGAQALRSQRRSQDRYRVDGRDESFDADYRGVSPKLGVRHVVDDGLQWFANLSRGLEPPSFGELSGGMGVTPVDAQRASSAELGVRVQRARLSLDAVLYRARIDGELLALNDAAGNPLGTINAGRTLHQGLELGLGWRFADAWTWSANGLWNDFRFDDDPAYGDNTLAGLPPHLLRSELRWQPREAFHVAPHIEWAGDSWIDHANTLRAPGYTLLGLRIGGRMHRQWSWFADLRNLQDRRWFAGSNVIADARGVDGRHFLPGDGRSLYVGVEWRRQ